jgi:hypothetical protein
MTSWSNSGARNAADDRDGAKNIFAGVLLGLFLVIVVLGLVASVPKAVREPAPAPSAARLVAAQSSRMEPDVKALESAAVDLQAQAVEIEKAQAKIKPR